MIFKVCSNVADLRRAGWQKFLTDRLFLAYDVIWVFMCNYMHIWHSYLKIWSKIWFLSKITRFSHLKKSLKWCEDIYIFLPEEKIITIMIINIKYNVYKLKWEQFFFDFQKIILGAKTQKVLRIFWSVRFSNFSIL